MSQIKSITEPWAGHSFSEVESFLKREMSVFSGDFVDLGLPSGNLWASCNLGATKPEELGLYYMWGDIVGHKADEGYDFDGSFDDGTNTWTGEYGNTTGPRNTTDIKLEYDAANVVMGGNIRIPTRGDFYELYMYCTRQWVTNYNNSGANGYVLTSKSNGKSIFLPAAGYCQGTKVTEASDVGTNGDYWESTRCSGDEGCGCDFGSSDFSPGNVYGCYYGFSVRAIQ